MTATMSAPLTEGLQAKCNICGEPVLQTISATSNRRVLLEATPAAGGMYGLLTAGGTCKAERRSIVQVHRELRTGRPAYGGGYSAHVCARGGFR